MSADDTRRRKVRNLPGAEPHRGQYGLRILPAGVHTVRHRRGSATEARRGCRLGHSVQLDVGAARHIGRVRRRLGLSYWSLSAYLKHRVKNAVEYVGRFEQVVAEEARRRNVDGVICGHIHHAEIRDIDGITYCNDGDWVESCTALVEHADGRLEILDWSADMTAFAPPRKKPAARKKTPPRKKTPGREPALAD